MKKNIYSKFISTSKKKKVKNPSLVVLMGLPLTGKTYVANLLEKRFNFVKVSGENITYGLFKKTACTAKQYEKVYKIARLLSFSLFKNGFNTVYDGTNLKKEYREQIYRATDNIEARRLLLWVKAKPKIIFERMKSMKTSYKDRDNIRSRITEKKFEAFKKQLEPPTREQIKTYSIYNNEEADLCKQLKKILK